MLYKREATMKNVGALSPVARIHQKPRYGYTHGSCLEVIFYPETIRTHQRLGVRRYLTGHQNHVTFMGSF